MDMQGRGIKLCEDVNLPESGIYAVGNRNVNYSVTSTERYGWL